MRVYRSLFKTVDKAMWTILVFKKIIRKSYQRSKSQRSLVKFINQNNRRMCTPMVALQQKPKNPNTEILNLTFLELQ